MEPPPPPPHGSHAGNKSSGLPPGNYDIFVIPPHSAGSGFLYLPSLQPHRNSFLAGVASTLLAVGIWIVVFPVLREWFATIVASGGMGVVMLLIGVGVAGWAWGKTQGETGGPKEGSAGGTSGTYANGSARGGPTSSTAGGTSGTYTNGSAEGGSNSSAAGGMPGANFEPPPSAGARPPPKPTWQRANTGPTNASSNTNANSTGTGTAGTAKGGWERAREETRKKEEERKKAEDLRKRMDELRKKREDEEKEKIKQRERDAREREIRERREKEAKEKREKEAKERREREAKEREEREKGAKEKEVKEKAENIARTADTSRPSSPTKRHQQPTAKTATEDDAYSFRPYDKPKRPVYKATSASSIYSESSYAPSQSTARTTPPPSHCGPYHTKDPDKIVIKAVYSFNNAFTKTPIAQLVSGIGAVTDGLILRITTEGLFIDDDVRGVPQREWDVKAWTMKLVEVWCPHLQALGATTGSAPASRNVNSGRSGIFGLKGTAKAPTSEETDIFLETIQRVCKSHCSSRFGASSSSIGDRSNSSASSQSGEHKGLHVLRATIRDQEGKRYVFVLREAEAWKVAVGLQRLRRGTQVRAMGVSGMALNETKAILENMGWT
ncbi:hypothetical protein MMC06_001289 [Schaereria dolodes]|nr:hypothetical protein [Schaereria dolodes]